MIQFYYTKILNRWTIGLITLPHIWSWSSNTGHIHVRYSHSRVRAMYKRQFRYNVLIWFRTRWQWVWEHPPPSWLTHWWCFGRARRVVRHGHSSPLQFTRLCAVKLTNHARYSPARIRDTPPDFHLTTAGEEISPVQTTALLQEHTVTTLEKSADNS